MLEGTSIPSRVNMKEEAGQFGDEQSTYEPMGRLTLLGVKKVAA